MNNEDHQVFCKGVSSISWSPKGGPHSQLLSLEDYKVFHKIARTLHLSQYMEAKDQRCLSPRKLTNQGMCRLLPLVRDMQVAWFGVHDPQEKTSCYGNVSFILDMVKLMNYCKGSFNIYFVEVVDFKTSNATRILFSQKTYDFLEKYDPTVFGGPWYIDPIGKHYWLQNTRRYDRRTNTFGHRLEFMLEIEPADASWLYKESVQEAVDHHEANSGKKRKCIQYGMRQACPSPLEKEKTLELINSSHIDQFGEERVTLGPSQTNNNESVGPSSVSPDVSDERTQGEDGTLSSVRRSLF